MGRGPDMGLFEALGRGRLLAAYRGFRPILGPWPRALDPKRGPYFRPFTSVHRDIGLDGRIREMAYYLSMPK